MFKKAFEFLSKIIINNENLLYCMEKRHRKIFKTKNGRLILKSTCSECNQDLSVKMKDLVCYQVLGSKLL